MNTQYQPASIVAFLPVILFLVAVGITVTVVKAIIKHTPIFLSFITRYTNRFNSFSFLESVYASILQK
jgi:hypothetical protein